MKKLVAITVILAAATAMAATTTKPVNSRSRKAPQAMAGNDEGPQTTGLAAKITVDQYPKLGRSSRLTAPSLNGGSTIGQCYTKPREWIVLESKYTTYAKTLPQLTFTWHVLLETKSATNKDREGQKEMAPYSYLSTSVTYVNIPQGSHAASVCLHPSFLETYGEAKAVGLVITNEKGDVLGGDTISEVKGIANSTQFWDDQKIMNATGANGGPMIERRQGLMDRSKTIWGLVNPNDYELVIQ